MANVINVVLAVIVLAPGFACRQNPSGGFDFSAEAERMQRLSLSTGARAMEQPPEARTPMANRRDWRVATEIPWTSYTKELTRALEPSYLCESRSETRTACVRQLPGDLLHLELVAEPSGIGPHIRISLEMHPD